MFEENFQNFNIDSALLKPKDPALQALLPPYRRKQVGEEPTGPADEVRRVKRSTVIWRNTLRGSFFLHKKFVIAFLVLLLALFPIIYGSRIVASLGKIFNGKSPFSFIISFGQLLTSDSRHLQGEETGEVNLLLLGIGGEGHEGALLTDTMMLATIRKPQHDGEQVELSLLSIPRDLIVPLPAGLGLRKINSAYAYGELGGKGLGAKWATEAAEGITGISIPYYALVDFSGFKKAIDDLGGIDVSVERTFTDSEYPDYQHGYLPTIKFVQGLQHMDGERALQFARSRHGTNGEGSDFARSRRQAKILAGMKERILKLNVATNLSTITKLLENFADHFRTNLEPWEMKRVYDLTRSVPQANILSLALDPTTGLLCNDIDAATAAYILTRCPNVSEADVYRFVADKFTYAKLLKEAPRLQIQNSTKLNGLAQRVSDGLATYYMETSVGNYPGGGILTETILYDLAGGIKPETLKYLQEKLSPLTRSDYPYPDQLPQPRPDFVVVLGTDATTFSTSTPETK